MRTKGTFAGVILLLAWIVPALCFAEGPKLGEAGKGPAIDKSGDAELQALIQTVRPKFGEYEYDGKDGHKLAYWLFSPAEMQEGQDYPLVVFMADASTAGRGDSALTQGYGALLWATPESQASHPCFVLVPAFSGVAVNDAFERSPEVDLVPELINSLAETLPINDRRLYATGQSMGGMIAMYFAINFPDEFAAYLFVDCHWDAGQFAKLARQNFIFISAGEKGKAFANVQAIEEAARADRRGYTTASWSAKLPQQTQDELAATMLAKGAPINLFNFEDGTVLPDGVTGNEHMYAFDPAYKLAPARDWLFKFSRNRAPQKQEAAE